MHFIWKSDFENERAYTRAQIVNVKELSGVKLLAGKSLTGLPRIELEIISDYEPADYFSAGPLFVVSDRLRTLLEGVNAAAEYHPLSLLNKHRALPAGREYFFANLLEKVDCFDYEKSVYTLDGEFIDKIEKLFIDENKAAGKQLFRLANSYDVITLVSDELADAVASAGLTGVKFVLPTDWKW